MYYIQRLLNPNPDPNLTPQVQNNSPVVLAENDLRRCPQDCLEVIYSYLDGSSLLTFRLVQKMLPEQEIRYSSYLNRYFQIKLKPEPVPYPSPYNVIQYARRLVYDILVYEIYYFPLETLPIFHAFDTVHYPGFLQTRKNLDNLAELFEEQKRPLRGLNLISSGESDHLNSLINDLVTSAESMAKVLPNLEHLYLCTDKNIEGLPALLEKINHLKTLVLNNYLTINNLMMKLNDEQLHKHFHALTSLSLRNTCITHQHLVRLLKSIETPLKSLDLFGYENFYMLPAVLNSQEIEAIFASIEDLKLGNIGMNPKILAGILKGCRSLRRLSLANCSHITGLFNELSKDDTMAKLERLVYGPCEKVPSHQEFEEVHKNLRHYKKKHQSRLHTLFKRIRDLNLSRTNLNHDDLKGILPLCSSLIHLNLSGCLAVSTVLDSRLGCNIIMNIKTIETLHLASSQISVNALVNIFSECRSLRKLNLSHCKNITEALLSFVMHDPRWIFGRITDLNLSHTEIETLQLEFLLIGARSLITLDLTKCKNITDLILKHEHAALENLFGHISTLNLSKTQITPEALQKLKAAAPQLEMKVNKF